MPTKTFINLSKEKQNRIIDAAIEEFGKTDFDNVNISDIIKKARIPRGSFYQYFDDKLDLFLYLFDIITAKKLEYLSDTMKNAQELPFFDLFVLLYQQGTKFAFENPQFVSIMNHLMKNRGFVFEKLMKNGLDLAREYYMAMIDRDKERGLIKEDIDSLTLADLVINMTVNVAVDEIIMHGEDLDFDDMLERTNKILHIFKKGILTGE